GTISGTSPHFTYTPGAQFGHTDTMIFKATDAAGFSKTAHITIQLLDPLVVTSQAFYAQPGVALLVTLQASGGLLPYTYTISRPTLGVLSGTAPYLTYTRTAATTAVETLQVTVTDANGISAVGQISFTGAPLLVAADYPLTVPFGSSAQATLS